MFKYLKTSMQSSIVYLTLEFLHLCELMQRSKYVPQHSLNEVVSGEFFHLTVYLYTFDTYLHSFE